MTDWKHIPNTESELIFITLNVVEKVNVFNKPSLFKIIIDTLSNYQQHKDLTLAGYIIMPDHLHLFCAGSDKYKVKDIMQFFKHRTANDILKELHIQKRMNDIAIFQKVASYGKNKNEYRIWKESYHSNIVTSKLMFDGLLNRMHSNPVRKGYVKAPEHWLYSSARNYILNDHSILRVECIR